MIVTGVVVALLFGAGAYGVVSLVSSPTQTTAASGCAANGNATAVVRRAGARLPTAGQIKLNVYNSTDRHGLAAATASQLKQRGFAIAKVTNDPLKANLTVAAQIRGSSAQSPAMHVVAAEVAGSQLQSDTRTDGTVDLVLGAGFNALASPDQVSAALKAQAAAAAAAKSAAGHCS
jgi:LytR cell envelope-related transcriptional attenuator